VLKYLSISILNTFLIDISGMNDWAKVVRIIDVKLLATSGQRQCILDWLTKLQTEADGERLGICLAIDLANEAYSALAKQELLHLLEVTSLDDLTPREAFHLRLEGHPQRSHFYCASRFYNSTPGTMYATVMRLEKFLSQAAGPFYFQNTPEDRDRVRRLAQKGELYHLSSYSAWWTAETGIVWVTLGSHLNQLLESTPESLRATRAKDALGLARPPFLTANMPIEYVAIQYPLTFTASCHQPTALDAWWRDPGQYYLSWGNEDSWGRTQSVTGLEAQVFKERVHRVFTGIDGEWSLRYVGVHLGDAAIAEEIDTGREILRDAAYHRLQAAPDVN
jgi:hypothetical protein